MVVRPPSGPPSVRHERPAPWGREGLSRQPVCPDRPRRKLPQGRQCAIRAGLTNSDRCDRQSARSPVSQESGKYDSSPVPSDFVDILQAWVFQLPHDRCLAEQFCNCQPSIHMFSSAICPAKFARRCAIIAEMRVPTFR
jgi:hypothetical protein